MPDWMQGVPGTPANAPMAAPGSLSVGSLLSEDAVPDWMRSVAGSAAALPPSPDPWRAGAAPAPGAWSPPPPPSAAYSAGQMPGFATGPAAPQNAASLFNESALPDWLREASAGQPPMPAAPAYPPSPFVSGLAPSAAPGPATPYPAQSFGAPSPSSQHPAFGQPGGLAANALFDAGALPTWLGGASPSAQPARAATPLTGEGLQVNSLVDERSLPMWLRQEPEQPQPQTPMPGSVSRWLSAPVTEEQMPPFLGQVYDAAQVSRTPAHSGPSANWGAGVPPSPAPSAPPMPGAVPSANLLDDSALPQWLRAQADGPGNVYQPPTVMGNPSAGVPPAAWSGPAAPYTPPPSGGAFAASDLIDPGAMPPWVQQGAPSPQPTFSSTAGWTDRAPAVSHNSGAPAGTGAGMYGGAAMNPGWDASALNGPSDSADLPSWLQIPDQGGDAATSGVWNTARHGVWRGRESNIPPSELPPWLQNGAGPQAGAARGGFTPPRPDSTEQQWNELQSGWDGDEMGHYLDRFGVEEPDAGRPFGMEYDQQVRAAGGANQYAGEQGPQASERGRGKRKKRGR
jgi:hypothetical protein